MCVCRPWFLAVQVLFLQQMAYSLIVTLELEEKARTYFTALRQQYFPAHRNYLDAHLTLFYRLPSEESVIREALPRFAQRPALQLEVSGVVNFGAGVAFTITSAALQQMHVEMQQAFAPWLVRQDRQPLRPHITIQNKVTAFKAQQLQAGLMADFSPHKITAIGINTWYYIGGPWKPAVFYPFSS